MIEHGGDGTPRTGADRDVAANLEARPALPLGRPLVVVASIAAAWWLPALLPGSVLPPTNGLTAFGLVAWWVALGVIGAAVAGPSAAMGLWLGTVTATLGGSVAVAVTGAAAPGWLDWAGHALAIMALAFLAGIPAARALARAGLAASTRPATATRGSDACAGTTRCSGGRWSCCPGPPVWSHRSCSRARTTRSWARSHAP